MHNTDPLNTIAFAMHDAKKRLYPDKSHVWTDDMNCILFPQTWGSTALGFGGIGGAAMTTVSVAVITSLPRHRAAVYFGPRHAYTIDRPNAAFFVDVANHQMVALKDAIKYGKVE